MTAAVVVQSWGVFTAGVCFGLLLALCFFGAIDAERLFGSQRRAKDRPPKANETALIKVRLDYEPGAELVGQPVMTQAYPGDAGWDLYSVEDLALFPGEYAEIACGFSIELPEGYWALLHSRSSSMRRGLLINTAVIDSGYRGPMFVGVRNLNKEVVPLKAGERLAQLILLPLVESDVQAVQELAPSERGSSGFGSSGR